jgi:hypothetical protein
MAFDVREYGALGMARPAETLALENLRYKWLAYPSGLRETIYRLAPGAEPDSRGIQRAIDAAHAAGGGTVVVPAGDYLIAPIALRSRVRLHLEAGATLWGSPELADYQKAADDEIPGVWQPGRSLKLLVSATQAEDTALTGMGRINAQSPAWVIPWMNASPTSWHITRPGLTVFFDRCCRVRVEGIHIHHTPSWSLVFSSCEHVQVHNVGIRSFDVINSDGIDIVGCTNVTITGCNVWSTDDAICLKSMLPGQTTRNVAVSNCILRTLCNGLKIGTETVGNFQDITFDNIVVYNPDDDLGHAEGGINLCAMDGGSVQNVNLSNIVMRNVDCPFYLRGGLRAPRQQPWRTPRAGLMERIAISNLMADGVRYTSWIAGQPSEPIRDVRLSNISIRKTREFYEQPPAGDVPDLPEQYPNPFMFGEHHGRDLLPAHGLYLRHVSRLQVSDFDVTCARPDARQFIVQENCDALEMRGVRTQTLENENKK